MSADKPPEVPDPLDPNSDPVVMKGLTGADVGKSLLAIAAVVVPALSIGLILTAGSVRRTQGALVSHHLEWERRQAEIETVIAKADSAQSVVQEDEVDD